MTVCQQLAPEVAVCRSLEVSSDLVGDLPALLRPPESGGTDMDLQEIVGPGASWRAIFSDRTFRWLARARFTVRPVSTSPCCGPYGAGAKR